MIDHGQEGDDRHEDSGVVPPLDAAGESSLASSASESDSGTVGERVGGDVGGGGKRQKEDRWAHRRGEPRVFAFLWTMYLLIATTAALVSLGMHGAASVDAYRPVARSLLLAIAVGIGLLWPMVRLSQKKPKGGGIAAAAQDVIVVLIPAQAVIWPQWWLAHWPLSVVVSVALFLAGWTLIVGAVLAFALGERDRERGAGFDNGLWMVVFVGLGVAAPLVMAGRAGLRGIRVGADRVDFVAMGSPLSGVYELTRDRLWSGSSAHVDWGHWVAVGLVSGVGLCLWWILPLRFRGQRLGTGVH